MVIVVAQQTTESRALPDDPIRAADPVDRIQHAVFERLMIAFAMVLPLPGSAGVRALADETLAQPRLASLPSSSYHAFMATAGESWDAIRTAHAAIAPMFWGTRVTLDDACDAIRSWISETFE